MSTDEFASLDRTRSKEAKDYLANCLDSYTINPVRLSDLDEYQEPPEWVIENVQVAGQLGVLGGRYKTLKTGVALAAAVAIVLNKPFLGRFAVPRSRPVVFLSGESGKFTTMETAERICDAYGTTLRDAIGSGLHLSFELPNFGSDKQIVALQHDLRALNAEVVFIDPAYLCMGRAGNHATNLFAMGAAYKKIAESCLDVGCTPILIHHFKTAEPDRTGKPDLSELLFSGIREAVRQWVLLGRREPFRPGSGMHRLWMASGGSIGHSGIWGVDVDEGTQAADFTGRRWNVRVMEEAETEADDTARKQGEREQRRQSKEEAKQRVEDDLFLAKLAEIDPKGAGVARRVLAASLKWGRDRLDEVIDRLAGNRVEAFEAMTTSGKGRKQKVEYIRVH